MPLSVIGAGLGRTGTMSLKVALEILGFGPCYHMIEVMAEPSRPADWLKAAAGDLDWDVVFAGYRATVDYPGCTYWRELAERYPSAKVLLSVRDPDDWFESTQATVFSPLMRQRIKGTGAEAFFEETVWRHYGDRIDDRGFMTAAFERHAAEVERALPAERLLVYRVGEGWDRLCEFLGVPVPETPFPRTNSRAEITAMAEARDRAAAAAGGQLNLQEMSAHAKRRIEALRASQGQAPADDDSAPG